ncbi:DUF3990 domain-containing protein [Bacteroides sp. 519]|uniref:DUF3990 domain-containing protein n=1 Tax=Bacteroides sp. 519 TaxID=2302937 RepID=UPI0013D041A2|nr:DUF3990 domain-containing protein [Bacteroides sp. 519]NDV58414.1 DUF3990 domain-containing protein [Bacteroides sp. 519]
MNVYHGSYTAISQIDLSKCEKYKDFGQGFYVTRFRQQAEEWAKKIGQKNNTQGVVTEFEFFESAFSSWNYKVLRFENYSNEWLDFIVLNRNPKNNVPAHDYDIVEGPVADDKIQRRLDKFLSGKISREDFLKELRYHEETHQICFCTQRALMMIENKTDANTDILFNIEDIGEQIIEALIFDYNINEEKATDVFFSSQIFLLLSNESTEFHKKTWQEIYELLKEELK